VWKTLLGPHAQKEVVSNHDEAFTKTVYKKRIKRKAGFHHRRPPGLDLDPRVTVFSKRKGKKKLASSGMNFGKEAQLDKAWPRRGKQI